MIEHLMEETQLTVLFWQKRKNETSQCIKQLDLKYVYSKRIICGGEIGVRERYDFYAFNLNPVLIPIPA